MANINIAANANGTVDPSAVASVVTGVLSAMGFQQSSVGEGGGDTSSGSGSSGTAMSNNFRNRRFGNFITIYI